MVLTADKYRKSKQMDKKYEKGQIFFAIQQLTYFNSFQTVLKI